MKTQLATLAVVSAISFGAQAHFFDAGHNWNKGSSGANTSSSKSATSKIVAAAKTKAKKPVGIVKGVMTMGGISRDQNNKAMVDPAFAKTSRPCPPFCIQPMYPFAPAKIATVTELDMIHAARDIKAGDKSMLIIDARTPGWVKKGTIPGAINVPFTKLNAKALAKDPMAVVDVLTSTFGVKDMDGVLNFDGAKTLYLFCNGSWCGQSPAAIKALMVMGYPHHKIKYYRGGMNDWKLLGLTTK